MKLKILILLVLLFLIPSSVKAQRAGIPYFWGCYQTSEFSHRWRCYVTIDLDYPDFEMTGNVALIAAYPSYRTVDMPLYPLNWNGQLKRMTYQTSWFYACGKWSAQPYLTQLNGIPADIHTPNELMFDNCLYLPIMQG